MLHAGRKTDGKHHQRGLAFDCSFASRGVTYSSGVLIPLGGVLLPAQMHHSHLTKGVEVVQNLSASSSVFKRSLKKQYLKTFFFLIRCNLSSSRWHKHYCSG